MATDTLELERLMAVGEDHQSSSENTPIRPDAFVLSDEEKINRIARNFREIMLTLGLDLEDDSLQGTPLRVAKMYVQEVFKGLNPENKPKVALFDNKYEYGEMLVEKNITLHSMCEHHFLPIVGQAHVAYISNGEVIGLSKINRIVAHYAARPQVQERLTREIANALCEALHTEDVAVLIDAKHYCVAMRGIQDTASSTVTAHYSGQFEQNAELRQRFLSYLQLPKQEG